MKKNSLFLVIPVAILCFAVIFSMAWEKTRKRNAEVAQIQHSVKAAIGDYLKGKTIKTISFNSLPIFYDKNRGILGCRVLLADENGTEKWTGFDCLLRREKNIWKAAIVDIIENPPMPQEKKSKAMDKLFKPEPEGR